MNDISDEYQTISSESRAKSKVKGSIFLAIAVPVTGVNEADEYLESWRKEYHDSTHIGWARRLAPPPDGEIRWSDDGEPSGTTGKPILNAIISSELWGVQVGVVRWFGGTKLGTGGLARAYGGAAEEAIANSKILKKYIAKNISILFDPDLQGIVYSQFDRFHVTPGTPEFLHGMFRLSLEVRLSLYDQLVSILTEASQGRVVIEL